MLGKDPTGQFHTNIIDEVIKAFGDVPAAFASLIDLDTNYTRTHLLIVNSLNQDIIVKFETKEITFPAGKDIFIDGFKHNGELKYKYKTSAPTAGNIQFISY